MKRKAIICIFLLFTIWIMLTIVYNVTPIIRGNAIAEKFIENLMNKNYTTASRYIESNNREEWINNLSKLEAEGISLTNYKDLKISLNDNVIRGQTIISLIKNGEKKDYRIFISFGGTRYTPLVSNLHYLVAEYANDEALDKWVKVINRPLH